jgi:hypothetical protein
VTQGMNVIPVYRKSFEGKSPKELFLLEVIWRRLLIVEALYARIALHLGEKDKLQTQKEKDDDMAKTNQSIEKFILPHFEFVARKVKKEWEKIEIAAKEVGFKIDWSNFKSSFGEIVTDKKK